MSHHVSFNDLPEGGEKFDPAKASGIITPMLGLGVLGLLGSLYYFWAKPAEFAYSWLFAFFFCFTLVVGGCFWILLHHASNSSWSTVIRRLFEHLASMAPVLFLFSLPLLLHPTVKNSLYEWMVHHTAAAEHAHGDVREGLHHMAESSNPHMHILWSKYGYLNKTFWHIRFLLYFVVLTYISWNLRRLSLKQEQDGDIKHTISARQSACRWLLFFALTVTFAAYDWLVGLDYTWFSTMYGVYIFAGCAWSSMALMLLVVTYLRSLGYLQKVFTEEHYHLMGKLLFAFTVFWAYIAFSQFFLIWYANVTEETRFYLMRNTEGWRWVSILLVFGHFVVPFVFLLQQQLKKRPAFICFWAIWVLGMHVIDLYWNIIPERGPSLGLGVLAPGAFIGDIVAFVTVFCLLGWYFLRSLNKYSLYPWRDPRLIESVNVVN